MNFLFILVSILKVMCLKPFFDELSMNEPDAFIGISGGSDLKLNHKLVTGIGF